MRASLAGVQPKSSAVTSDEDTLVQSARRDPADFETLYRRYRERIYWYIRARMPSEEDATDITQSVFLQALERLDQYRPSRGSFAAWLFAIARHAAADFHRRNRATVDWDCLPPALHPADSHDIEAETVRHEALARLDRLLAGLPEDKRELLALRFAGGLTLGEIAAITGKSPEATRKQLSRILQMLEDQYHESP